MRTADTAGLRRALVGALERDGLIVSPAVRDAFLSVPRERFVPAHAAREGLEAVYRDEAILTRRDVRGAPASSSSQPAIMALMLEQLLLERGMRVLEIGAGTGYNAALLARIAGPGNVVTIELDPGTANEARRALAGAGAEVVTGDGREGWADGAPYDRMIVTASADSVPRTWHEQLVEGGILVVPLRVGRATMQAIPALRKKGDRFRSVSVLCGGFMPLRGAPSEPVASPAAPEVRGPPRVRGFHERTRTWALGLYLALETPPELFVDRPDGFGVACGDGLALVSGDAVCAWGEAEAERQLERLLDEWRARGRPSETDLRLSVSYEGDESRVSHTWQE